MLNFQTAVRHYTHHTRWFARVVQLIIFTAAVVLAFVLRFDFMVPPQFRPRLVAGLWILVPIKIIVFPLLRLDRGWWRYASIQDLTRLATGNFAGSVLGLLGLLCVGPANFPRSIYVLDFLL